MVAPADSILDALPDERRLIALDLLSRLRHTGKAMVPSRDRRRAAAAMALEAAGLAQVRAGRDFHVLTRA